MFLLTIRIVAVALVVFSAAVHSAQLKAPLGLEWGQTLKQLEAKGVEFDFCDIGLDIQCGTKNPPKPLSFASSYHLHFIQGLQQVRINGVVSEGSDAKKQFADLEQRLTVKYGKPNDRDKKRSVSWQMGDAGIVLWLAKVDDMKLVEIIYYSKDMSRLLEEAEDDRL